MLPDTSQVTWQPSYRIISSRFPPVGVFDLIANERDFDALYELEGWTNPRLRQETFGDISQVPRGRRIFGPGTTPIMAAFTHLNPRGSRFSDGTYGVYYAAREQKTAIVETVYHREQFLRISSAPPTVLEMRCYLADIDARFHDLRGGWDQAHDPRSYASSQRLAQQLRIDDKSDGIVYDSVRHEGGECLAVFYPDRVAPVRQGPHFLYHWDGERMTHAVVANEIIDLRN